MNQKQIFTEYWRILDDFEDYMADGFSRGMREIPEIKLKLKVSVPQDPLKCHACPEHHLGEHRAPYGVEGSRKVLILNRPLPRALVEEGIQFSPQEEVFVSKWLEAIGLKLEEDCAVVSRIQCQCADPRHPSQEALDACYPYFERILKEAEPKAILQLGMDHNSSLAGRTGSVPYFQTYHPSDVLVDESLKRPVWEVLKQIKGILLGG